MSPDDSIFLNINLPNAATWFYFSALLAVALFFKFRRLLSVRNLDVLTLYLPVPGLLLLLEADARGRPAVARWGYVWLLAASGYLLARCLVDLALVRRPALGPNLNRSGLAWLGGALFASLVALSVRHPAEPAEAADKAQTPIGEVPRHILQQTPAPAAGDPVVVRTYVERGLSLLCHLAVVVGLVLVGWRHFQDVHAGVGAATFYLLLPYAYMLMPGTALGVGRWDHIWSMALAVGAVLAFRRPTLAGALLGLAAGSVFFPVVLLPAWLGFYWRRGACRFGLAFALSAGLCLAVVGGLLWYNGELPASLQSAWTLSHWQPWRELPPDTAGFWRGPDWSVHWAYRLPVFVTYVAFLAVSFFWPAPKNLAHVVALSAAALVGLQFWYPDRGGVHVLWYLPLLLLLVFRPNLSALQPAPPPPDDWLARAGRRLTRGAARLLRLPEPTARVA
jgi:hypothetical protein